MRSKYDPHSYVGIDPWRPCCAKCRSERIASKIDNSRPEPPRVGRKPGKTPVMVCDGWTCRDCGEPWDGSHLSVPEAAARDVKMLIDLGA
jgi:hypothetical protein